MASKFDFKNNIDDKFISLPNFLPLFLYLVVLSVACFVMPHVCYKSEEFFSGFIVLHVYLHLFCVQAFEAVTPKLFETLCQHPHGPLILWFVAILFLMMILLVFYITRL